MWITILMASLVHSSCMFHRTHSEDGPTVSTSGIPTGYGGSRAQQNAYARYRKLSIASVL